MNKNSDKNFKRAMCINKLLLAILKHKKDARMGNLWGIQNHCLNIYRDEAWKAKTQLD